MNTLRSWGLRNHGPRSCVRYPKPVDWKQFYPTETGHNLPKGLFAFPFDVDSKTLFINHPANHLYRGPDSRAMDEAKIGREETPSRRISSIPLPASGIPSFNYLATRLYCPLLPLGDQCLILASPANGNLGLNPVNDWIPKRPEQGDLPELKEGRL